MKPNYQSVYRTLLQIYQKHRCHYPENSDSKQMCCMWSTNDPPDIIEDTPPFDDIEAAFGIRISDDDDFAALELYDMDLDEAANKICAMIEEQAKP